MRILGKCLKCMSTDTIAVSDEIYKDEAWCENCRESWPNWAELIILASNQKIILIPVIIISDSYFVRLVMPKKDRMVFNPMIEMVLNTALLVYSYMGSSEEGLILSLASNNSIEGIFRGRIGSEMVELRNYQNTIGLEDNLRHRKNPVSQKLLKWYGRVMEVLFEEELLVGDEDFGRGRILKFSRGDSESQEIAQQLLRAALTCVSGKDFAEAVFAQLEETLEIKA